MELPHLINSEGALQKIGFGNCGSVWAASSDADSQASMLVIKREDGGRGRSLSKEHFMHKHILSALHASEVHLPPSFTTAIVSNEEQYRINIPDSIGFLESHAPDWSNLIPKFPSGYTACKALISERIMPVRRPVRQLLARKYWGEDAAARFADDKANEHCLIRPYLGRRRLLRDGPRRLQLYSLQNFPLHLDQIDELGLPANEYAMAMADTLAFLYWVAKLDAKDVEFVLARGRGSEDQAGTVGPSSNDLRPSSSDLETSAGNSKPSPSIGSLAFSSSTSIGPHTMWLLDFDCCNKLVLTEQGVEAAAVAFIRNDPFYPRPGRRRRDDQRLWETFEARFCGRSDAILRNEPHEIQRLPRVFIDKIKEMFGLEAAKEEGANE